MKNIKLLGIAPYEELKNSMISVGEQFDNLSLDVYTADLEKGQELAQQMIHKNYEAIISRGGTAELIQNAVSIPVIDVSISPYDILGSIKLAKNYTDNFVIVGYSSITETAHLICDILQYNIKIITIQKPADAQNILEELKKENYQLILCDAITNQIALSKSLNTLLITSGFESIKHAYQQAITISQQLRRKEEKLDSLLSSLQEQSQKLILFDEHLAISFSNVENQLEKSVHHFLNSKRDIENGQKFYHSFHTNVYKLAMKQVRTHDKLYYLCEITQSTPPIINNNFGITYINKEEIEETISKKLLFTSFISEESKILIQKLMQHYNAMLVFGQEGTAKTSLAYTSFLNQKSNQQGLIVIHSELLNEKLWKFLLNSTNGPLVDSGNTILFKNIEKLGIADVEKLIYLIKSTKLLNRNNLIFTYNTGSLGQDEKTFDLMLNELNCASIYSPSISERQNELSSIITLLLNKINIDCNKEVIGFNPQALSALLHFPWPGNLNQLEQVIKKLVLNSNSYYISEYQVLETLKQEQYKFPKTSLMPTSIVNIDENKTLFDYTQDIVNLVLEKNGGNQTKTAKQLGISRTTLWRYLK
ncbi:sigma-54-dependent Fis family transcriptional regulator [Streptococcus massiliensis]|uniref:Transcriptional regulatory protein ZraR n=1 Tax=Streptococcus massiliensis TaxID=313439 RepID=A0A380KWV9_9STRE|nr:PrpR N-terminal domain-containing protein [Streptococcus massiliensis]SUN76041.1 Transcriptional regulatory protein ZraR [Streptococcus massiliensis]